MSVIALRPAPADGTAHRLKYPWLTAGPVRRRWVAAVFAVCALFAGATALFTHNSLHRNWGIAAAGSYVVAPAPALACRSPRADPSPLLPLPPAPPRPLPR